MYLISFVVHVARTMTASAGIPSPIVLTAFTGFPSPVARLASAPKIIKKNVAGTIPNIAPIQLSLRLLTYRETSDATKAPTTSPPIVKSTAVENEISPDGWYRTKLGMSYRLAMTTRSQTAKARSKGTERRLNHLIHSKPMMATMALDIPIRTINRVGEENPKTVSSTPSTARPPISALTANHPIKEIKMQLEDSHVPRGYPKAHRLATLAGIPKSTPIYPMSETKIPSTAFPTTSAKQRTGQLRCGTSTPPANIVERAMLTPATTTKRSHQLFVRSAWGIASTPCCSILRALLSVDSSIDSLA
jgi:hypothetical protein